MSKLFELSLGIVVEADTVEEAFEEARWLCTRLNDADALSI